MGTALGERVAALESSMTSLNQHVEKLSEGIDKLIEVQISNNRTPWGTVISAAVFAVALLSAFGSLWIMPLDVKIQNLNARQDRLAEVLKTLKR